jgi:malonate transporter and related proteins
MPMSTSVNAFLVLLPVLFVMALGVLAGRAKRFDRHQVQGLNELILTFALPALLFVGVVTTPRNSLLAAGLFVLALLITFVGLFVVVVVGSRFVRIIGWGQPLFRQAASPAPISRLSAFRF